jgi:hypothetical protein
VRHRTPCLHLYHERPYANARGWKLNFEIRKRIRKNGETRAVNGIAELPNDASVIIRRPGEPLTPRAERALAAL